MEKKIVPVTLLTGYLGAGKTTLLNHVLSNQKGYKAAVIVNDIGEVNIDASLIASEGVVNVANNDLVPLQNGCICCTLSKDLYEQIDKLAGCGDYDYILIEASGICEPVPIVNTIEILANDLAQADRPYGVKVDGVISVVDAYRLVEEFGKGRGLQKEEIEEDDIENLIIQQIEFCTKIIVNKADLVSKEDLEEVKTVVRAIQMEAEIIEAVNGNVDIAKILGTNDFDFEKASTSAAWVKGIEEIEEEEDEPEGEVLEYNIMTFVYKRRKMFDTEKFYAWIDAKYPLSIIRCKGIVWSSKDPKNMYVFEQAGKQAKITNSGPWVACMPLRDQQQILRANPEIAAEWDERLGDRMIKLVFIGKGMDRAAIEAALDEFAI